MKKYDLSKIMKRAWELYKTAQTWVEKYRLSFSECLHRAWSDAKKALEKPVAITFDAIKALANKLVASGEYESISCKEWNNYGHSRIYIRAYRHTLAGNLRTADCGYWDNDNNQYVPQAINLLA